MVLGGVNRLILKLLQKNTDFAGLFMLNSHRETPSIDGLDAERIQLLIP